MAQESWYLHSSAVPEHEQRLCVAVAWRMTDAELQAERVALLVEQRELERRPRASPSHAGDFAGHAEHRQRLKAHQERLRTYHHALQQRPNRPRRYVE